MFSTYPECLIPNAMQNLGEMYAYAVERWHYLLDDFMELFLSSGVAEAFAAGNIELISGMSGSELANYVLWEAGLPQHDLHKEDPATSQSHAIFVAGQAAALTQRLSGRSF